MRLYVKSGLRRFFFPHAGTRAPCPYIEIPIHQCRAKCYFASNEAIASFYNVKAIAMPLLKCLQLKKL